MFPRLLSRYIIIFSLVTNVAFADNTNNMKNETYQNRLIHEKSPYLLQHADNPVDWYPWGDEAFNKAKEENKPVFLSIGYSTCHWCHVMEHESFENHEIASVINKYFVPVKVDREERPDIDNIYMSAVMAMTGSGGWPLSVFLTPDKKPFYGGTYFPPYAKWGSPGFVDIMESIHKNWVNNKEKIVQSSESIVEVLSKDQVVEKKSRLSLEVIDSSVEHFKRYYDSEYGGFGMSPKFPTSHNLSFLLRYYKINQDEKIKDIALHTLKQMGNGGMYDQIAGGFHRYSTDPYWQVPHFEKMLYDQALLSKTYCEAYQLTQDSFYSNIAKETLDYVLTHMRDQKGGFYSALDADSIDPDEFNLKNQSSSAVIKKEGAFYIWKYEEIVSLLKENADIFIDYYGVSKHGNARQDPHGEFTNKNILFVNKTIEEVSKKYKLSEEQVIKIISESKDVLYEFRSKRPSPHLDDKILVDWNGLMISSFAFAGRVLNEPRYIDSAKQATDFILINMIDKNGRLYHRFRDGDRAVLGTIDDYAFFILALIDVYEATFEIKYLQQAIELMNQSLELFWDQDDAGFYFVAHDAEKLLFNQKEVYDGAIPSGNSVMALNMARLYHMTLDEKWEKLLEKHFDHFAHEISSRASSYSQFLMGYQFMLGPTSEIIIAEGRESNFIDNIVQSVYSKFIPNKVLLYRPVDNKSLDQISQITKFLTKQEPIEDISTVYICENHICQKPSNNISTIKKQIEGL